MLGERGTHDPDAIGAQHVSPGDLWPQVRELPDDGRGILGGPGPTGLPQVRDERLVRQSPVGVAVLDLAEEGFEVVGHVDGH